MSVGSNVDSSVDTLTITFTSSGLRPAHSQANMVTFHIWSPNDFSLSLSDDTLTRVTGWRDSASCDSDQFVYQTARVMATAEFMSGSNSFTANVVDLIINDVSACILVPSLDVLTLILN